MTVHGANLVVRAAVLAAAAFGLAVAGCASGAGRSHETPPPLPRAWKEAVARELGKPPDQVSDADLAAVTDLSLLGTEVRDLAPLRGLDHLEWLDLSGTGVADLTPLAAMKHLKYLDLSGTRVTTIQPLKRLPNLKTILLHGTPAVRQAVRPKS